MTYCRDYKLSRMPYFRRPPLGPYHTSPVTATLAGSQCSCHRSSNTWSTSWLFQRTRKTMDSYRHTWLGTVRWFQQHDVASLGRPTFRCSWSSACPRVSATDASSVPQRRSGIDFHRRWGIQEWHTDSSVGSWRVTSLFEWDCNALGLCIKHVGLYTVCVPNIIKVSWQIMYAFNS